MRYQPFGRQSGLRVSEYVLGTANFGSAPAAAGLAGAKAIFEAFVAAGGTTFDVSNVYQDGEAESVLGELLGRERDEFVVITKYSGTRQAGVRPGTTGNSRKTMIRSLEESLRRLKTDHVDVFMPHFPDGVTPMPEILAGFEDLVRSGKIRYGGLSNFPAWRVAGAAVRSELSGRTPAGRHPDRVQPGRTLRRAGAPPDGRGARAGCGPVLPAGRRPADREVPAGRAGPAQRPGDAKHEGSAVLDAVLAVAEEAGTGPVQVALAWLRHRAAAVRTSMIPIVGPRTPAHLDGYLDALDVELSRGALPAAGRGQRHPAGHTARGRGGRVGARHRRRPELSSTPRPFP